MDVVPEGSARSWPDPSGKGFRGEGLSGQLMSSAWIEGAGSTFASFVLCGAVPLLPFPVEVPASFQLSIAMTALVFFLIGSTKSHWAAISSRAKTNSLSLLAISG
jgi:VIT1/CCC1 family predicted Fe2+/Mn2+ transporter